MANRDATHTKKIYANTGSSSLSLRIQTICFITSDKSKLLFAHTKHTELIRNKCSEERKAIREQTVILDEMTDG